MLKYILSDPATAFVSAIAALRVHFPPAVRHSPFPIDASTSSPVESTVKVEFSIGFDRSDSTSDLTNWAVTYPPSAESATSKNVTSLFSFSVNFVVPISYVLSVAFVE